MGERLIPIFFFHKFIEPGEGKERNLRIAPGDGVRKNVCFRKLEREFYI